MPHTSLPNSNLYFLIDDTIILEKDFFPECGLMTNDIETDNSYFKIILNQLCQQIGNYYKQKYDYLRSNLNSPIKYIHTYYNLQ